MSVDTATVRRIAYLARIGVGEDELEGLASELNKILAWVEQLDELDTGDVAPMASAHDDVLSLRPDEITDAGNRDDVLANAPAPADGFFTVPKVVE